MFQKYENHNHMERQAQNGSYIDLSCFFESDLLYYSYGYRLHIKNTKFFPEFQSHPNIDCTRKRYTFSRAKWIQWNTKKIYGTT